MAAFLLDSYMRNTQLYNIKAGNNYQNAKSGHSLEGPVNQGEILLESDFGP
jgi:hypothetical protein